MSTFWSHVLFQVAVFGTFGGLWWWLVRYDERQRDRELTDRLVDLYGGPDDAVVHDLRERVDRVRRVEGHRHRIACYYDDIRRVDEWSCVCPDSPFTGGAA
jgi:hypothetical protein